MWSLSANKETADVTCFKKDILYHWKLSCKFLCWQQSAENQSIQIIILIANLKRDFCLCKLMLNDNEYWVISNGKTFLYVTHHTCTASHNNSISNWFQIANKLKHATYISRNWSKAEFASTSSFRSFSDGKVPSSIGGSYWFVHGDLKWNLRKEKCCTYALQMWSLQMSYDRYFNYFSITVTTL